MRPLDKNQYKELIENYLAYHPYSNTSFFFEKWLKEQTLPNWVSYWKGVEITPEKEKEIDKVMGLCI